MYVLYFAGRIFLEYLSQKKLLSTYIWGGIIGGLFFVIAFNIFPIFGQYKSFSVALGSSASVLAILIAIATYVPDYSMTLLLFGRLKLKYIAIALVLIDILSIQKGNPGVGMGKYAAVIFGLGLGVDWMTLASIENDAMGRILDEEKMPKRVRDKKRGI